MRANRKNIGLTGRKKKGMPPVDSVRSFVILTACAFLAVVIVIGSKVLDVGVRSQVYAAADSEEGGGGAAVGEEDTDTDLPSGIAGVVSGVQETPAPGSTIKRIGTSCEEVMVGQRVKHIEEGTAVFNVSSSMESTINDLDSKASSLAQTPKMMSDEDYDTLLRIVEAEAGTEDVKGRILVANVIMNRVKHEGFPDSVSEVVWDYVDGVPQFSPVYDGRINEVTVTDETREAVKQALEGVDYSEGALFFIQKSAAEKQNIAWFEKDLKRLFKYGVHEFYTYPEEGEEPAQSEAEESETAQGEKSSVAELVDMK